MCHPQMPIDRRASHDLLKFLRYVCHQSSETLFISLEDTFHFSEAWLSGNESMLHLHLENLHQNCLKSHPKVRHDGLVFTDVTFRTGPQLGAANLLGYKSRGMSQGSCDV